jgi:transposase
LALYEGSGLTQREFARREGVNYHTLSAWLMRKRRMKDGESKSRSVRFAELKFPGRSAELEVCLPGGVIVRGSDASQMASLIRALR